MKSIYPLLVFCLMVFTACSKSKTKTNVLSEVTEEISLERRSFQYQQAYITYQYDRIEQYLNQTSKAEVKKILSQYDRYQRMELSKVFDERDQKVKAVKISHQKAEVQMCCDEKNKEFTIFWEKENGVWKVNYFKKKNQAINKK